MKSLQNTRNYEIDDDIVLCENVKELPIDGRTIVLGIPAPSLMTTASERAFVNVNVFGVARGFISANIKGSICKIN